MKVASYISVLSLITSFAFAQAVNYDCVAFAGEEEVFSLDLTLKDQFVFEDEGLSFYSMTLKSEAFAGNGSLELLQLPDSKIVDPVTNETIATYVVGIDRLQEEPTDPPPSAMLVLYLDDAGDMFEATVEFPGLQSAVAFRSEQREAQFRLECARE